MSETDTSTPAVERLIDYMDGLDTQGFIEDAKAILRALLTERAAAEQEIARLQEALKDK